MKGAPPAVAAAKPLLVDPTSGWLPAKAQLSMKSRLFSKNILYSRDLWAGCTATWTSTCVFVSLVAAAVFVAYLLFLRSTVSQGSSQQMKPLWQLSAMLTDDATINFLDNELDSDEYEDEQDESRSSGFLARSKERLALRRMLNRNEQGLIKRSSIVRITSSDPTSSLCENPIQVDLEPTTRRSFWPAPVSNTPPSEPSNLNGTTAPSPNLNATGQRSSSGSGSPTPGATRRRKESGRLLAVEAGRRQHAASPSRSPLATSAALPIRPARARPVDARFPLARTAARNKRNGTSSLSSADGATSSNLKRPGTKKDGSSRDQTQAASLSASGADIELNGTPSMASEASFTTAPPDHSSSVLDEVDPPSASACSSPTSSVFSISRAPSILKRKPQNFRTASLREIDPSYSLVQRKASLPNFPMLGSARTAVEQPDVLQVNSVSHGSSAPPPYRPSQLEPESQNSSCQEDTIGSRQTGRSIKLVEPDWRPHLDTHVRARERLETAARFSASKLGSGAVSVMDNENDQSNPTADDFWFERFTQSTAAAGRDWDWRKRRARSQRAAALGMALGQSGLASNPSAADLPGNVGKTDVQLQHQHGDIAEQPARAAEAASPNIRKKAVSAPLITFTEKELASASAQTRSPMLKVDTESGRRIVSRSNGDGSSLSPTLNGNGTPMSPTPSGTGTPLGGIFGGVLPAADSFSAAMTMRLAQRRRTSDDTTASPSTAPEKKGIANKIVRLRATATAAAGVPSSPGAASPSASPSKESPTSSPLEEVSPSQSFSASQSANKGDLDATSGPSSAPTGISPSVSVPGRISSLSDTVGKQGGLNSSRAGLRRGSGARTDESLQDSKPPAMELASNQPNSAAADAEWSSNRYMGGSPAAEGPHSRADANSYTLSQQQVPLSRTDSLLRGAAGGLDKDHPARATLAANKLAPVFSGGATVAKQASAPAASSSQIGMLEKLKSFDWERDSVSQGSSHSSDSLRRRMRSHTDTVLEDALTALTAASTSSPPTSKSRTRTGSRSSIMRSASGAIRTDLSQRRSSTRHASESASSSSIPSTLGTIRTSPKQSTLGSIRTSPKQSRKHSSSFTMEPDPQMQPEPAPRGMAQRARSASLSSNASSLASGASSRMGSRSNSFRGGEGLAGGLGLSMTSSNPGTPGVEGEGKRGDPFSMTTMSGASPL